MTMCLLKRSDLHSLDDTDLLSNSEEFDLVSHGEIVTLPTNVFIVISPFLRSVLRTILPCVRPTVMVPDVSDEALRKLKTIISHFHDHNYRKIFSIDELIDLDSLFDLLKINTGFFKISIANETDARHSGHSDEEYFESDEKENDEYGFAHVKAEVKDEPQSIDLYTAADDDELMLLEENEIIQAKEEKNGKEFGNETVNTIECKKINILFDDKKQLKCQFCSETFTYRDIILHLESHSEEYANNQLVCPEPGCGKTFHYNNSYGRKEKTIKWQIRFLDDHLRAKHTKVPSVSCPVCYKTFFSQMGLNYHKRQHDDTSKQYCDICEHFVSHVSYENHQINCKRTKGSENFKCQACGKTFRNSKHLEVHEGVHKSDKPFKCQNCPKAFVQKGNLKTHQFKKHC